MSSVSGPVSVRTWHDEWFPNDPLYDATFEGIFKELEKRGGGEAILGAETYDISKTIVIPKRCSLRGVSGQSQIGNDSFSQGVSLIRLRSDASPAIHLFGGGFGAGWLSPYLTGLSLMRLPPSRREGVSHVGVLVEDTNYALIRDVSVFNFAEGVYVKQSLGCKLDYICISGSVRSYVLIENSQEVTFTNCNFGRNGMESVGPPIAYVVITDAGPGHRCDTLNFIGCIFITREHELAKVVEKQAVGFHFKLVKEDGDGIYNITNCVMENVLHAVHCTSAIVRHLCIANSNIRVDASRYLFNFDALSHAHQWRLIGNQLTGELLLPPGSNEFLVIGNHIRCRSGRIAIENSKECSNIITVPP